MKKDQLAPLLLSLTLEEKKYFVRFTQLRSDDKSYMRLYKCVLRDKVFNADKLSKELKKTKANLAHEKEYLIENILKALRNCHDKEKNVELNNILSDAHLLKERRLNELSMSRMKKAAALAEKYGRNEIVWHLTFEERLLAIHLHPEKKFIRESAKSMARMEKDLAWMQDFTRLQKLYVQTETLYRNRRVARNKEEEKQTAVLLKHPALKKRTTDPLFRFFHLNIISNLNEQLNKKVQATEGLRKLLELAETHYQRIPLDTYEYFLILHGYLIQLVYSSEFAVFEKLMAKVRARYYRKLPFNQTYLDSLLDAHQYYYYMVMYSFQAAKSNLRTREISTLLADFEKNYSRVIIQFPPAFAVVLPHFACGLCFRLGNYEAALRWNVKIIHEGNPAERSEVQAAARLAAPILHAELKNYDILPSLVKSANRYLRRHLYFTEVERVTLSFLNKLPLLPDNASRKAAFKKLDEEYEKLETTKEGRYHITTFLYRLWVKRNM